MNIFYAITEDTGKRVRKDADTGQLEVYELLEDANEICSLYDECKIVEVSIEKLGSESKQGASFYDKNKEIADQLKELISEHYKETGVMVESLRTEHAAFVGGDKSITSISVSVTK